MNKAVFIDRDGTINVEVDYLRSVDKLVLIDKAAEALKLLKDSGFLVIIITNQSGIARGYFSEEDLGLLHDELLKRLNINGQALVDDIYFSPFHTDGTIEKYTKDSDCRKPAAGMVIKAKEKYNIDLESSYMIGDSFADMKLAENAGLKSFLVKTGYGEKTYEKCKDENVIPYRYVKNIYEASEIITGINN